jgi:putative hemolysin
VLTDGLPWAGILAVCGIVAAALALMLATAGEAALIYVNRVRMHVYANRSGVASEPLHRSIEYRNRLLSALEVLRAGAGVFAVAVILYLVLSRTGFHARPAAIACALVWLAIIVLQSVPRTIVRLNPEHWGVALAPAASVLTFLLGWLGQLLELPTHAILRVLSVPTSAPVEEQEEILRLVEMEESTGGIEEEERNMIRGVIGLEDTTAREIMVPRLDIAGVGTDRSLDDAIQVIVSRGFSRVPLYEGSIDSVTGIIYAKDVLRSLAVNRSETLSSLARPAYFIPETKRVDELLRELRRERIHIAIVVDEYGGTAGLVTIEDLLEEIVGEIEDEYDRGETVVEKISENEAIVDARASIDTLDELFGVEVESADFDTVGGFVYDHLGKIPSVGDQVTAGFLTITVLSVSGHRIKKLRIARPAEAPASSPE